MSTVELGPYSAATAAGVAELGTLAEHRCESRALVGCDLWMIDHYGSTVLRCRCVDVSNGGMRLRVPLGYGVAEGQRYELRSHLTESPPPSSLGLMASRWATVVRTRLCLDEGDDHLDVGLILDAADLAVTRVS
jgi:hypothetical protein